MTGALSSNSLVRLLAAVLLLSCAGCVQRAAFRTAPEPSARTVRLDVPFIAQAGRTDCGPAALASVLWHRGRRVPLDEITRRVFTPKMERTLLPDMENYAAALGFRTRSGQGDPAFLRARVDAGTPVILLLDMGGALFSQGHYVVVFGHDENGFLLHAGTLENAFLSDGELLERWQSMNRLYLVLE